MRPPTARRAAFTLIELLIVMAIIITLMTLALSAVFTLREAQMKSFTETTVQKLASALDQQLKAAIDQIRDEPVPGAFLTLAGGDQRRAKVIYLKARLKKEFPVSFYQAMYPYANYTPGQTLTALVAPTALPPKDAYRKALGGILPAVPQSNQTIPVPADYESSALLYLALSQARRGQTGFNPDEHVEATAIQTRTVSGVTFKIFVDSWGNPLRYYTFPYLNDELNTPPYFDPTKLQNQQSPDPQDPDQVLLTYLAPANAGFTAMVHPFATTTSNNQTVNVLRNLIPVVASAGRDGAWGLDYFHMAPTAPLPDANDNIYSYRLRRFGARGD